MYLLLRNSERGGQADAVWGEEEPVGEEAAGEAEVEGAHDVGGCGQLHGHEQAGAAHVLYGTVAEQGVEELLFGGYGGHHPFIEQGVHGGHAGATAQGVAAKSGDVAQHGVCSEGVHERQVGYKGAQGHATPEGLAQQEYVGHYIVTLKAPEGAGAAKPALYLVHHQQRAGGSAFFAELLQPCRVRGYYSCFALHGLYDNTCGVAVYGVYQLLCVEAIVAYAWHKRPEGIAPVFIAHYAECAKGIAVVAVVAGYYIGAVGGAAGQLYSAFGSLGARVGEVHTVETGGQVRGQHGGILRLRALHDLAIHHYVQVGIGLVLYGGHHARVAVAYVAYADAAYQVEVLPAHSIVEIVALCTHYLYAYGCGRRLRYMLLKELAVVHRCRLLLCRR